MRQINLLVVSAVLLSALITIIRAQDIRGRLLTPEEGCGLSKIANTKIVGGTPAKAGAFPWMALVGRLTSSNKGQFYCGGSLITSRHVLTAAHCLDANMVVRLGEHDQSKSDGRAKDVRVIRSVKHPNYTDFYEGDRTSDIAILYLEFDIKFEDRIRPICLPLNKTLKSQSFLNTNPFIAGWGDLKENGRESDILMQLQVPVVDNAQCKELFTKEKELFAETQFSGSVLCAGDLAGGKGSCVGDSGGPLMLPMHENNKFPMHQIGVISYGVGCARKNLPGVYVRVTHFMDWIQENIEE